MNHTSLRGVVGGLHLGEVDNVTGHGGRSDKATVSKVGELVAISISALFLLAPPVVGGVFGTVEGTVEINADYITVVLERTVDHGTLSPGNTGIGNEDVETAIEVLDDLIHCFLDGLRVGNFDLVSLG